MIAVGEGEEVHLFVDLSRADAWLAWNTALSLCARYPCKIVLHPIDDASLRARRMLPSPSADVRKFEQMHAARWARLHSGLSIPSEYPNFGVTHVHRLLRSGEIPTADAESFVSALLGEIWAGPEYGLDDEDLQRFCAAHGVNATLRADEAPATALELASSFGIPSTPAFVLDGTVFLGFEQTEFLEIALLESRLSRVPSETLKGLAARLLARATHEVRERELGALTHTDADAAEVIREVSPLWEQVISEIKGSPSALSPVEFLASPTAGLAALRLIDWPVAVVGVSEILDMVRATAALVGERTVVLVVGAPQLAADPKLLTSAVSAGLPKDAPEHEIIAPIVWQGRTETLHIQVRTQGPTQVHCRVTATDPEANGAPTALHVGSFRWVHLDGAWAENGVSHRAAAAVGAHLILMTGLAAESVSPQAAAIRTGRWVVSLDPTCAMVASPGGEAHGIPVDTQIALSWPPSSSPEFESVASEGDDASQIGWRSAPARTALVNDEPLCIGGIDSHADLGLAVIGRGLALATAGQRSTVSATRKHETVRLPNRSLIVLPLLEDQIICAELALQNLLGAVARSARDAAFICVSYWPELEYERLKVLRVLFAELALALDLPVVCVVGRTVVEVWHVESSGRNAYRIEASADTHEVDLSLQPGLTERRNRLLARMGDEPKKLMQMMHFLGQS